MGGLRPGTKFFAVRWVDAAIMKKLDFEREKMELERLFKKVDRRIRKYGEMTEEEIDQIIRDYRAKTAHKRTLTRLLQAF